jgi:hypothetical protein
VNELRQRLERLADAGADGIDVTRPEPLGGTQRWWQWRGVPALVAAAALITIVVGIATITNDGNGDDAVVVTDDGPVDLSPAAVAVTYGEASVGTAPVDLVLRFFDADGEVVSAERSWSEVEEPIDGAPGEVVVLRGLVQEVPAGDLRLEATLQRPDGPVSCTQPFATTAGARLILRLQIGTDPGPGADPVCASIETVEEWVQGRTSGTGAAYVGLTEPEAEARAEADGLTTRVVAADGMAFVITADLRPDRLDLMVFDGVVVASQLGGEEPMADPPATGPTDPDDDPVVAPEGEGTLAIDLEPIDGVFIEGFDVTLRFHDAAGDLFAEREWSDAVTEAGDTDIDAYYSYVLHETVPAGQVRLVTYMRISPGGAIPPPEGPGCDTTIDIAAGDTARVTLLFSPEDLSGGCAAVTSATATADESLGLPRGLPAPGFVGLTEDEATSQAAAHSWTVRVVARDGEGLVRTEDYNPERVNVVVEDGIVTAAART